MVNLRPRAIFRIFGSPERFGADLYLVDWLDQKGFPYDVVTDEVSLVETYRGQFRKLLAEKGFDGLLSTLKRKRDQLEKENAAPAPPAPQQGEG